MGENLFQWMAAISGPRGTLYEGGIYFVEIALSRDYPFKSPKVRKCILFICAKMLNFRLVCLLCLYVCVKYVLMYASMHMFMCNHSNKCKF